LAHEFIRLFVQSLFIFMGEIAATVLKPFATIDRKRLCLVAVQLDDEFLLKKLNFLPIIGLDIPVLVWYHSYKGPGSYT